MVEIGWDKVLKASYYSITTTLGFWIAFFLATIIVYTIQKIARRDNARLQQKTAKVGPIMMAVELIDAIPEAALLAESVSETNYQPWTLVIAILFMNISNGLFTSFDVIAVLDSPVNNIVMFVIMNFSTGMLCYAISVTIYGDFKLQFSETHHYTDLVALVFGTMIGSLFIFIVKYAHENHKKIGKMIKSKCPCYADDDDDDEDSESEVDELERLNTVSKKHLYEKALWWKFLGRILFSFIFLLILSFWSVGLTVICAILFDFLLSSHDAWASIMGAFLEGLGGGAFLGTIACTIIPELGKTYGKYVEHNSTVISFSGLFFFIFGLLTSTMIDTAL